MLILLSVAQSPFSCGTEKENDEIKGEKKARNCRDADPHGASTITEPLFLAKHCRILVVEFYYPEITRAPQVILVPRE